MALAALNLRGKRIAIIGAGTVATRKLSHLLNQGAIIRIISPAISEAIQLQVSNGQIQWIQECYSAESLIAFQAQIVFAATDDAELNHKIADDARKIGAWVNNASDSADSDFHTLATIEKEPIRIGISTQGTSPALVKMIKERIEQAIGDDLLQLAGWLAEIRPTTKDKLATQSERQELFRAIVASDILGLLREGKTDDARARFESLSEVLV